ncbi:MAG: hypothetical protein WBV06_10785, partial [Acidimicrobiia bacterium]
MSIRKLAAFFAVLALLAAACGGDDSSTTTTTSGAAETTTAAPGAALTVGVSWNNYNEERWAKADEPAMKAAIEAAGGTYIST